MERPQNNTFRLDGALYYSPTDITTTHLATFQERLTFGDPTARDDEYLSNWAIRRIPGGIGIEEYDEGTDAERIAWAKLDTRYAHGITLPPYVRATRPSTVPDTAVSFPLGVVGTRMYTCFSWSTNHHVFGWDEENETWLEPASANALAHAPAWKPVYFAGNSTTRMFVPHGASNGYSIVTVDDDSLGELTITAVTTGLDPSNPDPIRFCVFTVAAVSQLWAIDAAGHLYVSGTDGTNGSWVQPDDGLPSNPNPVKLDASETPRHLFVYKAPNGDRALHVMSDRALWVYNPNVPCFERTEFEMSPHPDNALGLAVFRPGENVHVTQGLERWQYTTADVYIPNTGPSKDDGVPAQFRGKLVDLVPDVSFLFAILQGSGADAYEQNAVEDGGMWYDDPLYVSGDAAFSALLCDTSLGWHVLWESETPLTMTWGAVAGMWPGYALWFGGDQGDVYRMALRPGFHNARQGAILGLDEFAETGYFITGWFDAAMLNFDKIAADMSVTMKHATTSEYVDVFYQVDDSAVWTSLGRVTSTGRTLLAFGNDGSNFFAGVAFNQIRFRFDVRRGSNVNTSPVFTAFTLHFVKIPQDAQTFEIQVDLPRENEGLESADEIRDRLSALLLSRRFVIFEHARRRYRVLLTRLNGFDATGRDEAGRRTLTLLALEQLEDAA